MIATPRGRHLLLLSGGLDSATLLAQNIRQGLETLAVSVNYGQRHAKELLAAEKVGAHYSTELVEVDLSGWGMLLVGSSLTDPETPVPHGHYADVIQSQTIVPNRNATLLMVAAGIAVARGCTHVQTAVHMGDCDVYPDCRPEFIDAITYATHLATDYAVTIEAPFQYFTKTDIARLAAQLEVPVNLAWSCYEGTDEPCTKCGACVERLEAFAAVV